MNIIFKLISLFSKKEKRRLILITIVTIIVSLLGIIEVASIGPFVSIATNFEIVREQPALSYIYELGNFDKRENSETAFLIFFGILIFAFIIFITVLRTLVSYVAFRFAANRRYTLGVRLFSQYLYQPYQFFLNKNSGELSKNLLSEVDMVINYVMKPSMNVFINGTRALAIFVFLIIMNPVVALSATVIFGLLYYTVYITVRKKLRIYGKEARTFNLIRYKAASEAFGGIKDIKISGKEHFFIQDYAKGAKQFSATQASKYILSSLPPQVIHSLTIGFAIALLVIFIIIRGSLTEILPFLSVMAFSVMRLVPNIQHIFTDSAQIRYYTETVNSLFNDMTGLTVPDEISSKKGAKIKAIPFNNIIELKDIHFSYTADSDKVLKGINITIKKNTSIAFAGVTGCGKTTLVDVIMGLLHPTGGSISADGVPVIIPQDGKDNRMMILSWQLNFGYVPQFIYICDDTVSANIAFGIPINLRNNDAIQSAAKAANLHDFIVNELPSGYDTIVGERGIRLSGGQRQRIGIARALYSNPEILVMDEATSALDSITEDAVMDAIQNLMHTKTIIIIAHRITTIQNCDAIYLMDHGTITATGTYNELLQNNKQFRAMAKVE